METFKTLDIGVVNSLKEGKDIDLIDISQDLMGDVIRHMAMDVEPSLEYEFIIKGLIGSFGRSSIELRINKRLKPGSIRFLKDSKVIIRAQKQEE